MRRCVYADSLLTRIKAYRPYMYLGEDALSYAIKMVESEPTADVVEVVRCKDCKWKQGSECVRFAEVRPFPDDFCSRAERKDNG